MTHYRLTPKAEEDLIEGARWIRADNVAAAKRFLDCAFDAFDRLTQFPESGAPARLKHDRLIKIRFTVLSPPFNRWLVFYSVNELDIDVLRVVYGTQNWRNNPASFFI